ncbi:hypothetical protein BDP27DRAFT_649130 [Rhodocollybia butyracea]|uniref:Uncharacterized protein n=1 Tax=Rhodocollybia butyracea TaxID=206335 RepID=A0A9P5PW20_9AGAR|nr:hypothetical protein BDP27DRAFT_649130 [Rhodocollybia butyracea]
MGTMHTCYFPFLDSNGFDTRASCECMYDSDSNSLKQLIQASPLSLFLTSEPQTKKSSSSEPLSSLPSEASNGCGRAGQSYRRNNGNGRDLNCRFDGKDEGEMDLNESDEGYDSYNVSSRPQFHSHGLRRVPSNSPGRFSPSTRFAPPLFYSSPLFPSTPRFSQKGSLSHPVESSSHEESESSDSSSNDGIELRSTLSGNESLRRRWHALSFRVRLGVFKARRKIRDSWKR